LGGGLSSSHSWDIAGDHVREEDTTTTRMEERKDHRERGEGSQMKGGGDAKTNTQLLSPPSFPYWLFKERRS